MDKLHSFHPKIADIVGVEKAVVIHYIRHWTREHRHNDTHYYDGHYWVYVTSRELSEVQHYFSRDKAKRMLRELVSDGHLASANYNKRAYDKTLWYRIANEDMVDIYTKHGTELHQARCESAPPIPLSRTIDRNIERKNDPMNLDIFG